MNYLEKAIKISKTAGQIILKEAKDVQYVSKNSFDILAKADTESEKYILQELAKEFPSHRILSEEAGDNLHDSEYQWIVDPLDGTINFSQGLSDFCVSIALLHQESVIVSVIYQPVLNYLYTVEKGSGSCLNGKKISVANKTSLKESIAITESASKPLPRMKNFEAMGSLHDKVKSFRISGSAALNLARIASGTYDFYFNHNLNYWDVAAGSLLIQEAGGLMTDMNGAPIHLKSQNSIAANPQLHSELTELFPF